MPLGVPRATLLGGGRVIGPIADTFDRPNQTGLGETSDEEAFWEIVSGSWEISNNRAYSSTSPSSNPIAVVDARTPDVDLTLGISASGGGDALYARVLDASNWVRLRYRHWRTSSTSCRTVYCSKYYRESYCPHDGSDLPSCPLYKSACGSCPGCYDQCPEDGCLQWQECDTYSCGTDCDTTYSHHYYGYVEQSVAGSVTQLDSFSDYASQIGLRVVGDTVEAFSDGTLRDTATLDPSLLDVDRHGIGRGDSYYTGSAIDNFNLVPAEA